jgi:multidrug resistance efflux pump
MDSLPPIPIPWRQRWRDVRVRYVPALIFIAIVFALALLWKGYSSAPMMVGQAEAIVSNLSCYKAGVLAQLTVSRFQKVKAGDAIGQVQVTDPRILAASLAVIQAEIDEMRVTQQPIAAKQRVAMDYGQLYLDWMRQRAQLGMAKANLQFAETDFQRTEELFKEKIVSERVYDQAREARDRSKNEVDELTQLVEKQTQNIDQLQLTNTVDISKVTMDPLQTAIATEEAKLKLTEAELSPVTLRAPVDGMVDTIYHRIGEAVTVGEPIISIAPFNVARIIGYQRAPILEEPKVGTRVQVRTRGPHQQTGIGEITEVGTQFEPLPAALQVPVRLSNAELGLPLCISVPPGLKIRPGELVDLQLNTKAVEIR